MALNQDCWKTQLSAGKRPDKSICKGENQMYKRELYSMVTALSVFHREQVSLLFFSQAEGILVNILEVPWKKGLISTRSPPAGAGVVGTPRYV